MEIRLPPLRRRAGSNVTNPPHPGQMEVIRYLFTPERGVKIADLCCGIGYGKTQLCLDVFQLKLEQGPQERVLFFEPDLDRMNKLLVAEWRATVPRNLYNMNEGKREVHWHNGAIGYFQHRDIRTNKAFAADRGRGFNLSGIINDESAIQFYLELMVNLLGRLRIDSPNLFMLNATSPKVGPWGTWMKRDGHVLFRGRTVDNPYLKPSPKEYDAMLRENMSELQARRELDGELVALEGRIFPDVDLTTPYPDGNLNTVHDRFIDGRDWYLFCDLGSATGAFAGFQMMPSTEYDPVWTGVFDYCPNHDPSAEAAFKRIKDEFGIPAVLVAGGDVNTRNSVTGTSARQMAKNVFGSDIEVRGMSEHIAVKEPAFNRLRYLQRSAIGVRRFTVAENFIELDTQTKRGVRQTLEEYAMRDVKRSGEFLPKGADQPWCHCADAMIAGAGKLMAPQSEAISGYDH